MSQAENDDYVHHQKPPTMVIVCQHGFLITQDCPGCDGLWDGEDHEPVFRSIPIEVYERTKEPT